MAVTFLENWEVIELIEQQKGCREFENYSIFGIETALEKYSNGKFDNTIHKLIRNNPLYFRLSKDYEKINQTYNKFNKEYKSR